MKKKVHIIPHTHWDREWYFTSQRSTIYLIAQIKEVLDVLEGDEEFRYYLLDAQSSLVYDYLKYYPEDLERVKKLVQEQRLLIGPWFTQSDLIVVSSESVVRNLYYGISDAEAIGHSMKIGYVPDSFGQGGNMPQIYKSFGIDKTIFWRGIGDDKLTSTEFVWQGSDGSKILGVQIPYGYFLGANFPEKGENYQAFIDVMIPKLENRCSANHIYFPNGFDQLPINKDLVNITKKLNEVDETREYVIASPESYFKELDVTVDSLPKIYGELLEGKNSRVHKTIFSSRSDLKIMNNTTENYVVNIVEPIALMKYFVDGKYPHKEIETIWKLLFENAAHDSIGSCNSDATNADIYHRYKKAYDLATNLVEYNMRVIAQSINQEEYYSFTVFNPLPYKRSSCIETEIYVPGEDFVLKDDEGNLLDYEIITLEDQSNYVLHQAALLTPSMFRENEKSEFYPERVYKVKIRLYVRNVPGLGYLQFYLYPNENKMISRKESKNNIIENENYIVCLEANNSFTITNKKTQRVYKDQIIFYENGDDGDSYNYSPPRKDKVITSYDAILIDSKTIMTSFEQRMELSFELEVPYNLEDRSQNKANTKLPYTLIVSLEKDSRLVKVKTEFQNNVYSHRVCMRCHSDILANYSIADQFFGVIKRQLTHPKITSWKEDGWAEAPIEINPMQSFVSLSDKEQTLSVITKGVREYEVVGKNLSDIQLTLFRTFSYMGKEDLLYRPGRASGEAIEKTPDAEILKNIACEFALNYEDVSFDELQIAKIAKEYLSDMQVFEQVEFLNSRINFIRNLPEEKKLPVRKSYLEFDQSDFVISALKKAEHEDAMILRGFNPYLSKDVDISHLKSEYSFVKLDEAKSDKKDKLQHCEFVTLKGREVMKFDY